MKLNEYDRTIITWLLTMVISLGGLALIGGGFIKLLEWIF